LVWVVGEAVAAGGPRAKDLVCRWEVITTELRKLMPRCSGSYAIEETVLAYNTRYQRKWKFQGLHSFVKGLPTADSRELLERTIPAMARLALRLPDVCPGSIALLQCGVAGAFHIRVHLANKSLAAASVAHTLYRPPFLFRLPR
jgi:hypothetical protein